MRKQVNPQQVMCGHEAALHSNTSVACSVSRQLSMKDDVNEQLTDSLIGW